MEYMFAKKINFYKITGLNRNHIQLLLLLIQQSLTIRYKRSVIGIGWTLLNPMLTSFILWIVFSFLFAGKLQSGQQFAPYLMAGVLLNSFFQLGLLQSANSISGNKNILTKVAVPSRIFAFAAALAAFINFIIGLIPLAIVVYISGQNIEWTFPIVFLTGLLLALFVSGIGLFLSIIFIRFEDTVNVVNALLLMLAALTPIFYPIDILSKPVKFLVNLNPLTSFLDIFRWSFSDNAAVTYADFFYIFIISFTSFILGNYFFKKHWSKTIAML